MRLFVAVWPPAHVVDALRTFADGLATRSDTATSTRGARWTSPAQWHVTLRFLGQIDEGDVVVLAEALRSVAVETPAAACVVGPATETFGRSVLVVPVSGLDHLAAATVAATSSFGEPPDDRPFAGHVTLARSGRRRGTSGPDLRRYRDLPVTAAWVADELTLVCSHTSREGARYEVLARFDLQQP